MGAPFTPGRRCSPDRLSSPAGACRSPAASPALRLPHSIAEANFTRHHQGFIRIHPSGLPLTCSRRMARRPLGLNFELHTPPLPVTHVGAGTGIEHSPGTTRSSEPPFEQSSRHVRPRVARSVIGAVVGSTSGSGGCATITATIPSRRIRAKRVPGHWRPAPPRTPGATWRPPRRVRPTTGRTPSQLAIVCRS